MEHAISPNRPAEYLEIVDSRTQAEYILPITNNTVNASDFANIKPTTDPNGKAENGLVIFDRGFTNTACFESSITLLDGQRGQLKFRGYDVGYLYENHDYEEIMHLLIWRRLPSIKEKEALRMKLVSELEAPQTVKNTIQAFPRQSMIEPMILAGLAAFVACDEDILKQHTQPGTTYLGNMDNTDAAIFRSIAAVTVTIALVYCHKRGREFTEPDPKGSYIGNVLRMMGKEDKNRDVEKCLSRLWVLFADHGMTNSTSAFLHAASTLTDPSSCCISAMVSAYGPIHGGAIEMAYSGMQQIGSPKNVPNFLNEVKAKRQRLYGFGHRIYKAVDPRLKFVRKMIEEQIANPEQARVPLLEVALEIDKLASTDPYFVSRRLSANADLYSALLYTVLGFELDIIVAMTGLARVPGLMAHWRESMQQSVKIWRPQALYHEPSQPAIHAVL
ncbi:citrate synthase [Xylaria sp. FL1042]|nr:citrate synthase [Xylaria sp. FL1042]